MGRAKKPYLTGIDKLDKRIHELSRDYCDPANRDLLDQILITSMKTIALMSASFA